MGNELQHPANSGNRNVAGGNSNDEGNSTGSSGTNDSNPWNETSGDNRTNDFFGMSAETPDYSFIAQFIFNEARSYIDKQASDNPDNQNLQWVSNFMNLVGDKKMLNAWNALSILKQNMERGQFLNIQTAGAAITIVDAWPEITRMVTFLSGQDGVDWNKILEAIQQQISASGAPDLSAIMRELESQMNRFKANRSTFHNRY